MLLNLSVSNEQELEQSEPKSRPKPKREITKITNSENTNNALWSRVSSSFPEGGHSTENNMYKHKLKRNQN